MTASDASAGSTRNPAQAARKVVGEAFTAAWAGQPLSTEISFQWPTSFALEPWDFLELNELLDLGDYTPADRTRLVTTVAKSAPGLPDIVKLQLP